MNDIVMYFAYVSPEGSHIYAKLEERDGVKLLHGNFTDTMNDYSNAYYFLAGDLNARAKDFFDYIPSDNLDYIFGETDYEGDAFNMARNNKDMQTFNLFGKTLTEFCRSHDLHIMNGRLHNDLDGNFTCTANNGASTVDYNISSTELFKNCTYFNVENRAESDPFPLFCQLTFEKVLNTDQQASIQNDQLHDQVKFR